MYILDANDLEIEYPPTSRLWESFSRGKAVHQLGVKNMGIGDRWLTNMEMNDLTTYLKRVNRFKNATENWIREFEYFLTIVEGAHGRRQNAGI